MAHYYAVHIESGHDALAGEYPVLATVYRYANRAKRDSAVSQQRQTAPDACRWYAVAASDKLVASAKFFGDRGVEWPIHLIMDEAHAPPRRAGAALKLNAPGRA